MRNRPSAPSPPLQNGNVICAQHRSVARECAKRPRKSAVGPGALKRPSSRRRLKFLYIGWIDRLKGASGEFLIGYCANTNRQKKEHKFLSVYSCSRNNRSRTHSNVANNSRLLTLVSKVAPGFSVREGPQVRGARPLIQTCIPKKGQGPLI
jgi:hypothetical protein